MRNRVIQIVCLLIVINGSLFCAENTPSGGADKDSVIRQLQALLDKEMSLWYPKCIDSKYGGYYSDFNYKWDLSGRQDKMIVSQARHIWSASNTALFYNNNRSKELIGYAAHGFAFLKNVMWDKTYGGFYNLVDRSGKPIPEFSKIVKQVYGNAFAVYGLAAYYKASHDTAALALAKQAFAWIDKHNHDSQYGGYFQFTERDGTPLVNGIAGIAPKDQNCAIHLLECFTELYGVWPDAHLRDRIAEMLHIIRDVMIKDGVTLQLFFSRDYTPVSYHDKNVPGGHNNYEFDHISFGHNVETTYLLLEASQAINSKYDSLTIAVGKKMDDYALDHGWDKKNGGLYDAGYIFKGQDTVTIVKNTKEWWVEVEALNSFLMMARLFPDDAHQYYQKFLDGFAYMMKYAVDPEYGGWYWDGLDTAPQAKFQMKGSIWKADYHTSRGVINCIRQLQEMK